jgi:hypothetical protein
MASHLPFNETYALDNFSGMSAQAVSELTPAFSIWLGEEYRLNNALTKYIIKE